MADEPAVTEPTVLTGDDAALVAEFEKRHGAASPENKTAPVKEGEPEAKAGPEGKAKDEGEPVSKDPAPNADAAEDLSHVPEQFRSVFASMPPEARQWVKDNAWGKPEYTRKTQELAEQRKAFEAEREKIRQAAEFGSRFMADDEAMDHFVEWSRQRKAGSPSAKSSPKEWAPPKPWDEMTSDEVNAAMRSFMAEAERKAEERAEARARAEIEASVTGPQKRDAGILRALGGLIGDSTSATDVKAAFLLAREHYARIGVIKPDGWNEENTAGLVEPFLALAKAQGAASKPAATNGKAESVQAQGSPLARGAGPIPSIPLPPHMREKRKARTRDELIAETMFEISQRDGRQVGLSDLDAAWRPGRA